MGGRRRIQGAGEMVQSGKELRVASGLEFNAQNPLKKPGVGPTAMAHQEKALAAKPNDLNSIPGAQIVE